MIGGCLCVGLSREKELASTTFISVLPSLFCVWQITETHYHNTGPASLPWRDFIHHSRWSIWLLGLKQRLLIDSSHVEQAWATRTWTMCLFFIQLVEVVASTWWIADNRSHYLSPHRHSLPWQCVLGHSNIRGLFLVPSLTVSQQLLGDSGKAPKSVWPDPVLCSVLGGTVSASSILSMHLLSVITLWSGFSVRREGLLPSRLHQPLDWEKGIK